MNRTTISKLGLFLSLVAVVACTTDKAGTAGHPDASASGGAGGSAGGSGGARTGGAAGTDASVGGGGGADAGQDGAVIPGCTYPPLGNGDAGLGPSPGVLLVGGTDYTSTTQVVALNPATGTILGNATYPDGDAVPAASGGVGFVLERTLGALDVLTSTGTVARRVLLRTADGGAGTNPHDVVLVPGSVPRKAYVSLYDASAIAVVDIDAGSVTKTIDLSAYMASGDTDGSVEVDSGLYDGATGRAYFSLERIDLNTARVAPYQLACPAAKALVVGIDPATDTLVDLNGSDAGTGYSLGLVSHSRMAQDPGSGKALLLAEGCFQKADGGSTRVLHGVESLDLATGVAATLLAPTSQDFLGDLQITGAGATVIESFDALYVASWHAFGVSSSSLGQAYSCVPDQAVAASQGRLLGATTDGARISVVAYDLATQSGATVAANIVGATTTAVAGLALVK